ncbi:curli-like amyloid fiber formation chaperone CsgH [Rhodopseudomonas sp. BR0G17]|uniref:curli-like amyloid fiber formation chaperone CsgH n=1 Tax=Rhodopseudomonas sp. BR0G17 TaxID=2269368 RepID=UPI0032DF0BEE
MDDDHFPIPHHARRLVQTRSHRSRVVISMFVASRNFSRLARCSAGLLLISTWSSAANASKTTGLDCEIRNTPDRNLLRIDAVLHAQRAAAGEYQLNVFKQSTSGVSQNAQSGTFELTGPTDQVLTSVIIDQSPEAKIRAELTIRSNQGSVSCVSP